LSCRQRRGGVVFASPGRRTSTHWSRWSCLDGTKSR